MRMNTNKELYPIWESTSEITGPVGMEIIYKYVIHDEYKNSFRWEVLPNVMNRKFTIESSGIFVINDEEGTPNSYIQKILNNFDSENVELDDLSMSYQDEKIDDPEKYNCLSYDSNQINSSEKPFFFCMNQKISSDDRIIIASAHLPFEIDKIPGGNFIIRETNESIIYSNLYRIKEKGLCEVVWVGMLKNFQQYSEEDLENIKEILKERNIYMVNITETDYKNYWIYIDQIIGDVFVSSTIDIHK
jgi:galactitol-specific phosphotransferase system IIB component